MKITDDDKLSLRERALTTAATLARINMEAPSGVHTSATEVVAEARIIETFLLEGTETA